MDFRLYVILDKEALGREGNIVEVARQVILGGADILQLRAKACSDRQILKIGQAIKKLTVEEEGKRKVLFILNDRVDLALTLNTDGVHLGQEDLPIKAARDILGKDKIIGVSTHSPAQADAAEQAGADYIALGAIFPTATKPEAPALGTGAITEIKDQVKVPFVAVGGINLNNLNQVLSHGAQRVAICRAIITTKDVRRATEEFKRRLCQLN